MVYAQSYGDFRSVGPQQTPDAIQPYLLASKPTDPAWLAAAVSGSTQGAAMVKAKAIDAAAQLAGAGVEGIARTAAQGSASLGSVLSQGLASAGQVAVAEKDYQLAKKRMAGQAMGMALGGVVEAGAAFLGPKFKMPERQPVAMPDFYGQALDRIYGAGKGPGGLPSNDSGIQSPNHSMGTRSATTPATSGTPAQVPGSDAQAATSGPLNPVGGATPTPAAKPWQVNFGGTNPFAFNSTRSLNAPLPLLAPPGAR